MEILAATQADNVALESETLGQGLLPYAPVHDGLKHRRAVPEGAGPITLKGWLYYAETRVPKLYDEMQAGTLRALGFNASATQPAALQLTTMTPSIDKVFLTDTANHAQTPTLFDFFKGAGDPVMEMGK